MLIEQLLVILAISIGVELRQVLIGALAEGVLLVFAVSFTCQLDDLLRRYSNTRTLRLCLQLRSILALSMTRSIKYVDRNQIRIALKKLLGQSVGALGWLESVSVGEYCLNVKGVGVPVLELGDDILGDAVTFLEFLELHPLIITQFEIHLVDIGWMIRLPVRVAYVHMVIIQAILLSWNSLTFGVRVLLRHRVLMALLCILRRLGNRLISLHAAPLLSRGLRVTHSIIALLDSLIISNLGIASVHDVGAHGLAFEGLAFIPLPRSDGLGSRLYPNACEIAVQRYIGIGRGLVRARLHLIHIRYLNALPCFLVHYATFYLQFLYLIQLLLLVQAEVP